jgi:hypothetical protein
MASPHASGSRESIFAQTIGFTSGTGEESAAHDSCRQAFILKLARWFDWRSALLIIKPATLIGWHRNVAPVLELEIETGQKATSDGRSQRLDPAFSDDR